MKTYKLMIKTHCKTGLKYLCITSKKNWEKYLGSGVYWSNHLKKYGKTITTELLIETSDYDYFVNMCKYYSNLYDVVNSDEWANSIPEMGYDNVNGICAFSIWWQQATIEDKEAVYKKRKNTLHKTHWVNTDNKSEICAKISKIRKKFCDSITQEDKNFMTLAAREGAKHWRETVSEDDLTAYRKKLSLRRKEYIETMDKNLHSKLISDGRKNMSNDKKLKRKEKIQQVYATGKHNHLYEKMSKERVRGGNPAAKKVLYNDVLYASIKEAMEATGLSRTKLKNFIMKDVK